MRIVPLMIDDAVDVSLAELRATNFAKLGKAASLHVIESDFPECYITRSGKTLSCHIEEHIYTKFWEHKFHAKVFAEAMVRAIKRFASEGRPLNNPEIENDDEPHIFIRWTLSLPTSISGDELTTETKDCWEAVWLRANQILEDSESVLVLGKDTGPSMKRLKTIASILEESGHYVYIIKEQPDRLGESIIQKVLRYALLSRFVVIENTEPSGHLYELPHVAKMAECVTAVLQEDGKGATWMFEDAYGKSKVWRKFTYRPKDLPRKVAQAAQWAHATLERFARHQKKVLPWLTK